MNKEVIYLEPEDDITDILTKLQRAEQKLVALVPPKKATILRSAVNMKLVARAAKECKKIVVVVTADPAIAKLAMTAQIPVAKTLQSRPVIPTRESIAAATAKEQVIDEDLAHSASKTSPDAEKTQKDHAKTAAEASKITSENASVKTGETIELNEESLENGSKEGQKTAQKVDKHEKGKKVPDIAKYRKWIILGVFTALFLVVFGVWAFVFAPAVKITVAMSTSASNFAEEVRFTTDAGASRPAEGILYAEKQTYEMNLSEEFEATGKEDRGERATGTLSVQVTLNPTKTPIYSIGKGTKFTASNGTQSVTYAAVTSTVIINWDGESVSGLNSNGCSSNTSCTKRVSIEVEAIAAGTDFNISAGRSWNTVTDGEVTLSPSNSTAFAGGASNEVTVVTQSNVDTVVDRLLSEHQSEGRSMLFSQIADDDLVIIEPSFGGEAVDVESNPAIDAEVDPNGKPKVSFKAVYAVYTVTKAQVEEFVQAKMTTADDQKIYSIGSPYFERFTAIEETARLKTVVKTGPTVTEEEIIEKAKGRKLGEVQALLRSINGVSTVNIEPSFFWVRVVPEDASKITVELTVEGN